MAASQLGCWLAAGVSEGGTPFLPNRSKLEDRIQMINGLWRQGVLRWSTAVAVVGLV